MEANIQNEQEIYELAKQSCTICNSCRYCEGFCAVFPAMESRRDFKYQDIDYLANLCHQCGECFYACQYAPPHEFNVNIPSQFGDIRAITYEKFAFGAKFGKFFNKNGFFASSVLMLCIFVLFLLVFYWNHWNLSRISYKGNFYEVLPYEVMVGVFSVVGILVLGSIAIGFMNFFSSLKEKEKINLICVFQGIFDALSLKYLGGYHHEGCTYSQNSRSNTRKYFHHFAFYGFLFCFVATCLGGFYDHFLHQSAPYAFLSAPKLFGTFGGIFLCIGTLGLFVLKLKMDKRLKSLKSMGMDYAFIFSLFIVSLSGLCLMLLRKNDGAMVFLVLFHLSAVLALFLIMPYGKFIHGFYRIAALIKYALETKKS
ncbi:tricarballylate utilization 4Fe-4S protein TcuB [Helicobacter sp. 11S03491-1]|uniref:tricarballylate utilization 4Fe-4S protein TcuB n=1 Tax=Helicobacter sp. 11S03491-1 TaxID=1476196 RepID=UPI000BA5A232|nr:tricarballylate utilization 4Fe-4S protein TcuB [Helicobacter sp. 11S03491-1]